MNKAHGLESVGVLLLKPPGSGYVVPAVSVLFRTADTTGYALSGSGSGRRGSGHHDRKDDEGDATR